MKKLLLSLILSIGIITSSNAQSECQTSTPVAVTAGILGGAVGGLIAGLITQSNRNSVKELSEKERQEKLLPLLSQWGIEKITVPEGFKYSEIIPGLLKQGVVFYVKNSSTDEIFQVQVMDGNVNSFGDGFVDRAKSKGFSDVVKIDKNSLDGRKIYQFEAQKTYGNTNSYIVWTAVDLGGDKFAVVSTNSTATTPDKEAVRSLANNITYKSITEISVKPNLINSSNKTP